MGVSMMPGAGMYPGGGMGGASLLCALLSSTGFGGGMPMGGMPLGGMGGMF